MKSFLQFLLFFLLVTQICSAQWTQQNSGTTNLFYSCFFLDENTGWTAGEDGTILKTTDGGENWFSQSLSTSFDIYSIFFTNSLNGWLTLFETVPYNQGSIMHTTDGGNSWHSHIGSMGSKFHKVHFSDINNGWVTESSEIIYHTTNGGTSWIEQYPPTQGQGLYPIFFIDNNVGWTAGNPVLGIFKSTNGGDTWLTYSVPVVERINSIKFFDYQTGWLCAAQGGIAKSLDGGITWQNLQSGTSSDLMDIFFVDNNIGWCVGHNGTILHTIDGGANWLEQNSGINYNLFGVFFANSLEGWVVGDNGIILRTTNGGVSPPLIVLSPNGGEVWPVGSTQNITWNSTNVPDVKIELSTNNGTSWTTVVDSTPSNGIYSWTVPNTPSNTCKVKVSDITNPLVYDESDSVFSIIQTAFINVNSPNGGEVWPVGSIHNITWNSTDVLDVKIELSTNNGASWTTVVDSTPSSGIYGWTVPNSPSIQSLIKISDINSSSTNDESDSLFTIDPAVYIDSESIPEHFALYQNYPNPFNPSAKISYSIPELSLVTVKVYDVLGNEVAALVNEEKPIGSYEIEFDASTLPSGVYFYRLQAGSFVETKKMVLMK